jgi:hypothetical protein
MHGITERYLSGQKADAAGFVRKLLHDLESKISVQFGRVRPFCPVIKLPKLFEFVSNDFCSFL